MVTDGGGKVEALNRIVSSALVEVSSFPDLLQPVGDETLRNGHFIVAWNNIAVAAAVRNWSFF